MKEETKSRLAGLLVLHEQRAQEARQRKAAEKTAGEQFIESWRACCTDTVVPVLQDFADELNAAGHAARIVVQQERLGANGRVEQSEGVLLTLIRENSKPDPTMKTELTFYIAPRLKKVSLRYGLTNSSGPWGDFNLGEVTGDFVEARTLAWLNALFTGAYHPGP